MPASKVRLSFGIAIIVVTVPMITQPPLWISLPLLAVGAFLFLWGMIPRQIETKVSRLPKGEKILAAMAAVDWWLDQIHDNDSRRIDEIGRLLSEGSDIKQRKLGTSDEFQEWKTMHGEWVERSANFLASAFRVR